MEIYKRLPEDIQEMINNLIHKSQMKTIENELDHELNKRWLKKTGGYLKDLYPTKYARYNLQPFIRPDKVIASGYSKFEFSYNHITLNPPILFNATYGEILLEVDKMIIEMMEFEEDDYDDIALDVIEIDETIDDEVYGKIHILYIELF